MARRGEEFDDEDTSPYCKARARLPEAVPFRSMRSLGYELHDDLPEEWRWCGRRVKVVDGTTVSMPDTAANQREYPQSPSQKPGLGFPIARMVVVFCLATGSVLEAGPGQVPGEADRRECPVSQDLGGVEPATCRWGIATTARISTWRC